LKRQANTKQKLLIGVILNVLIPWERMWR